MLIRSSFIQTKHFALMLNLLVALFFVSVLVLKKGYSYVPMVLGSISIIYTLVYFLKFKQKWQFSKSDKWLIFSFLFYFITFLLSIIINKDSFREIDNPSRILLFIPLLLLFSQFPIKIKTILYSISVGAMITGLTALFQKFQLGYLKPFPEIMHIQVGNIAISLATFSLVIAIYFTVKREYKSALFYFIRNLKEPSLEIKCIAILGVTHILSHLFYFMSQSFLAHNSGSIFYFFVLILLYVSSKK